LKEIKDVNADLSKEIKDVSKEIKDVNDKLSKEIKDLNNKFIPLYLLLTAIATATGMAKFGDMAIFK
jgi:flagellar capping protein FliD